MVSPGAEIPSHRACAHCRSQKVRCIASEDDPDTCQRCAKSGRACVFTPLQKRKQRKRTDTRVAELEREMRSMRAAFKQKQEPTPSQAPVSEDTQQSHPLGVWYKGGRPNAPRISEASQWEEGEEDASPASKSTDHFPKNVARTPAPWPGKTVHPPSDDDLDVIDKGLISLPMAQELFETYKADLFQHYPIVVVPSFVTADEMRASRPTLFLAILAAAACKEHSDLSAMLDGEILQAYATRCLVRSEKSLELVQALLISAVWYHPPVRFGQLKYYEYIHMAAIMAMDLGIDSQPMTHRARFQQRNAAPPTTVHPAEDIGNPDLSMAPRVRNESPDTASIESRRTFLACYTICSTVSFSLRRPNMLRANSYIRSCVDCLERSPDAIPTDRTLVAWVKLVMIADEIRSSFSLDDTAGIATITELRTQLMLRDFSNRLKAWRSNVQEADMGPGSLAAMYYTVTLYLHEIALHVDHSPEDFRAPYQMGAIQQSPAINDMPTKILAESISECISAAHSLINTFTSIPADSLRTVPVFTYVRVSFGSFVLAKLCLSASHPGSRIGNVIDRRSIKAESYMDQLIFHVRNVVGIYRCRVPAIFLALLFKLRQWCINPEIINQPDEESRPDQAQGDPPTYKEANQTQSKGSGVGEVFRLNEISSSDETSPNSNSKGLLADVLSERSGPVATSPDFSDEREVTSRGGGNKVAGLTEMDKKANAPTLATTDVSIEDPDLSQSDQMDVEDNLFDWLGNVNAFSAGGLTGLDDWGMLPLDSYSMDMMNYQGDTVEPSGPPAG